MPGSFFISIYYLKPQEMVQYLKMYLSLGIRDNSISSAFIWNDYVSLFWDCHQKNTVKCFETVSSGAGVRAVILAPVHQPVGCMTKLLIWKKNLEQHFEDMNGCFLSTSFGGFFRNTIPDCDISHFLKISALKCNLDWFLHYFSQQISNRVEKFMKLLPTLSKCLFLESTVLHSNGIHTIHNMFCR